MKKQRKILAVAMCVVLIATMVPFALFASAEGIDYTGQTTETNGAIYIIDSPEDLKKLADTVNAGTDYSGATFQIDKKGLGLLDSGAYTIDLSAYPNWTPIGNSESHPFAGTIESADAHPYHITGITQDDYNAETDKYSGGIGGLFGYVTGKVSDIIVKNSTFTFGGTLVEVGPVVAHLSSSGIVEKCAAYNVTINTVNEQEALNINTVGGLVGYSAGSVDTAYSRAELFVSAPTSLSYVGGIVGCNENGTIRNTYFAGNATLGNTLIGASGGIAGTATGANSQIVNSYNAGLVGGQVSAAIVGWLGTDSTSAVKNCYYHKDTSLNGCLIQENGKFVPHNNDAKSDEATIGIFDNTEVSRNFASQLNDGEVVFIDTPSISLPGGSTALADYKYPVIQELKDTDTLTGVAHVLTLEELNADEPTAGVVDFAGGNGTLYNPFQIETPAQLAKIKDYPSKSFTLKNDIAIPEYEYCSLKENAVDVYNALTDDADKTTVVTAVNSAVDPATAFDTITIDTVLAPAQLTAMVNTLKGFDILKVSLQQKATLVEGIFANDGFTPIGSASNPFYGSLIGDGSPYTISNIVMADDSSSVSKLAPFVYNYGKLKNFNIQGLVVLDSEKESYAAGVVATNIGVVDTVGSSMQVVLLAPKLQGYAAGIVADNKGTVKNCTNTGVVTVGYHDPNMLLATDADYAKLLDEANLAVAGIVALNEAEAVVTDCKTTDSAVSRLRTNVTADNIHDEDATVAINKGTATNNTVDAGLICAETYVDYEASEALENAYDKMIGASADDNTATLKEAPSDDNLKNSKGTVSVPTPYYATSKNNGYQRVSVTYEDTYTPVGESEEITDNYYVDFLVWIHLSASNYDISASMTNAKTEFIQGEDFDSTGLVVTATTKANVTPAETVNLHRVEDGADDGYVVKVFSDEACTTEVSAFKTAAASPTGTPYYVQLKYGEDIISPVEGKQYTYTIKNFAVKSITASAEYETYMVGQTPRLTVKAVYGNTAETTKTLDPAEYTAVCGTLAGEEDNTFTPGSATFAAGNNAIKVTSTNGMEFIVKPISVVANDIKVSSFTTTTGGSQTADTPENEKIHCDNIKLAWTDDNPSTGTIYTVYRKEGESAEKRIATTSNLTYTDNDAKSGVEYTYRIVMKVAGQESTGSESKTVTAITPDSVTIDTSGAKKKFALNSAFSFYGLSVTANYKNGTHESMSENRTATPNSYSYILTVKDDSETIYARPNTNTFASSFSKKPGTATVSVKCGATEETYPIQVLAPVSYEAKAKYTYYPIGYPKSDFIETLTVQQKYADDSGLSPQTVTTGISITDEHYTNTVVGEKAISVDYLPYEGVTPASLNVGVTFVDKAAPTIDNDKSVSQLNGVNKIVSSTVTGALDYKLYRTIDPAAAPEDYEYIGESEKVTATATEVTYLDSTAKPGETYYYKVTATIADFETDKSVTSNGIVTTAPVIIHADGTDVKWNYAVGEKLNTRGLEVNAYYAKTGKTPADISNLKSILETSEDEDEKEAALKNTLDMDNPRQLDKIADDDLVSYGYTIYTNYDSSTPSGDDGYLVEVRVNGSGEYNDFEIGQFKANVYPVYSITATPKKTKYPVGYNFTANDLNVKVVYGKAGETPEEDIVVTSKVTSNYSLVSEPNMNSTGTKTITVVYANDPTMTATCSFQVYSPTASPVVEAYSVEGKNRIVINGISADYKPTAYNIYRSTSADMSSKMKVTTIYTDSSALNVFEYNDTFSGLKNGTVYYYMAVPVYDSLECMTGKSTPAAVTFQAATVSKITPNSTTGYATTPGREYLTKVQPGTSYSSFVNNMKDSSYIKVYTPAGAEVTSGTIGTGYVVKLIVSGVVKDTIVVAVMGDTTGDGAINIQDVKKTLNTSLGKSNALTGAYLQASDVNADGKVNVQDVKKILNVSLGKTNKF